MKAKNLIRTLSALVLAIGMLFHTSGIRAHAAPGFTVTNTATIQTSQANDYSSQIQFNIHAEVTGQVHAGDTIRYDFENINITPLNGLDVTTTPTPAPSKPTTKTSDATNVMMYGAVGIGAFCIANLIFIRKFKQSK